MKRKESVTSMPRFDGKWILITGAAGGMGLAFAKRFAAEGASLLLSDIAADGLEQTANTVRKDGAVCHTVIADLSVESGTMALASAARAHCSQLDALINNGGIAYGEITHAFEGLSQSRWLHFLSVNTLAPLALAQALRPLLAAASGAVINISSMASFMPGTAYGVTKAALNAITYGMASAFGADGIRVNAIAPGIMETSAAVANLPPETFERVQKQQMLNRRGLATDIADLAAFLASDDARFISCEIISCDAGNRMRGWR